MAEEKSQLSGGRELAQWAYTVGKGMTEIRETRIPENLTVGQIVMIPDQMKLQDLKPFIPKVPERKTGALAFTSLESFIQIVNEQKLPESRIFARLDCKPATFRCVVDFHQPEIGGETESLAGWQSYYLNLVLNQSPQFIKWDEINGKMLPQTLFAEFLKDNRLDISEPCGADVLNLVLALEATECSHCRAKVADNTGMILSYEQDTKTNVKIPSTITLRLPLFAEADDIEVPVEFRFRIKDGNVMFGIRMLGIERTLRDAVRLSSKTISERTGLPVYV